MSRNLLLMLLLGASAVAVAATLTKPSAPKPPASPAAQPTQAATPATTQRPVIYDKSEIAFSVTQMGVAVAGQFRHFTAQVNLDPAKPESSSANVEVDIASVNAGSDDANDIAVTKPWLDAAGFPKAGFKSSAVRLLGPGRYEVKGMLAIKGKSRELTVPLSLQDKPDGSSLVTGEFSLRRTDFGIGGGEWDKDDVVANDIPVHFKFLLAATH
jgi:polyisoprenoid-binding protein YceI